MIRLAPLLFVLCLAPAAAQAQGNTGRDQGLGFVTFGTVAPSILFDALIISDLFSDDYVRRGFGINAAIFGSIALATGALMALILLPDLGVKGWGQVSVGLAAVGAGTIVLGIWGVTHSRPPETPYRPPDDSYRPPPPPPPENPPPPPSPVPTVQLFPSIGVTPSGGVMLGLAGAI